MLPQNIMRLPICGCSAFSVGQQKEKSLERILLGLIILTFVDFPTYLSAHVKAAINLFILTLVIS